MSALGRLDYSIENATLTSSTGEKFEFKDLISSLDFYESLLSPYIKCEITIIDASNMIEVAPIIGQERIDLVLLEGENIVRRTFYVGSVENYIKANNQASVYTLKLITAEQMMNSLMLVSHAYSGTIDLVIAGIVKDYLKSKIKNKEMSVGNYDVIIPNWNPYQAIDWLTRRAMSAKKMPFAFYETIMDGYSFESYESMFKKKTYNKFVHKGGTTAESDAENQAATYNVAIEYDLKEYSNTHKNALRGTFGSSMWEIDIATKSYRFIKYNYGDDFKKKDHLDKVSFLNQDFKIQGKPLNEYNDAYHHVVNKNTLAFGNKKTNNYNNEAEFTKLETDPFMYQLTLNKMSMAVRGRMDLCPGKVIEFSVDKDKPMVYGNTKDVNEYISGKYLVLNTHHKLASGKYITLFDAVRDSLGKKVQIQI
jgi:hypothetical protein